jgi:serine/threonine protein kinase
MSLEVWPKGHKIKGRYEVKNVKSGGMAIVYICFDHEFQDYIAVKTFKDIYLHDKLMVNRFLGEAEAWMRLEKHGNIVWAKWVDNINGRPYIFMEYITGDDYHGPDLNGWIGTNDLDFATSLDIAIQVCTGMIYTERKFRQIGKPFVHRDLKPSNIMITRDKVAKVTDFGIARVCAEFKGDFKEETMQDNKGIKKTSFTKTGNICGTPHYMSPEQWMAKEDIDIRSDIYSFGCVLYAMVTGRLPFDCDNWLELMAYHLNEKPVLPSKIKTSIPSEIDALIVRCLEKQREFRYQDFNAVREDLKYISYKLTGKIAEYKDAGEELSIADLSNIAMSLNELRHSEEAIKYYDRIITRIIDELNPEMVARVLNNRANCYLNLYNYEKAIVNYELAKRIDTKYELPWHNSAYCYMALGNYQKALAESNQSLKINPYFSDLFVRRAEIFLYFKDYKKAIEDCNQAIALEPKHVWAYRTRAQAFDVLGDINNARKDYEMARKLEVG